MIEGIFSRYLILHEEEFHPRDLCMYYAHMIPPIDTLPKNAKCIESS